MFSNFIKKTVLCIGALAFILAFAPLAKSASSSVTGVIISPPIVEKEVQSGSDFSGIIKVTNPNSDTSLKVSVSINDFKANGEEGDQTFIDPVSNLSFGLGSWITIEKEFTLSASETKDISYTVKIPANAEPGGHYGVIFFSPVIVTQSALSGSGVTAVPKIGSLLLFTVPGEITYSGSIAEFSVGKKYFMDNINSLTFLTRFQNSSTNHVKPQGEIVIKNIFGKQVASLVVNEKIGNALPDSIRKFENTWKKKYGFGLYKAHVNLAFGDSGSTSADLSFWIIPWKETAGAVVILILLIWILSHLRWGGRKSQQPVTVQQPVQQPLMTPPFSPEKITTPAQPTAPTIDNTAQTTPATSNSETLKVQDEQNTSEPPKSDNENTVSNKQ